MISNKAFPIYDGYVYYKNASGIFFIYNPVTNFTATWYVCRDEFRGGWDGTGTHHLGDEYPLDKISRFVGFGGLDKTIDLDYLDKEWTKIEDMLGLAERSIIHPVVPPVNNAVTSIPSASVVFYLSPFWIENDTRRSLATLLMRMFVVYGKSTLDESIEAYHLSQICKPAIKWFLAGNTKPTAKLKKTGLINDYVGFVNQYANLSEKELAEVLVKP